MLNTFTLSKRYTSKRYNCNNFNTTILKPMSLTLISCFFVCIKRHFVFKATKVST